MNLFEEASTYHDSKAAVKDSNAGGHIQPAYSLFASKKILTMHAEINIANSNDEVLYTSKTKALTLHDATTIVDKDNNEIAKMEKKMFSIHAKHLITMSDGTTFQLSNEILHIVKEITDIEGLGWKLRGSFVELKFDLLDENGKVIAIIGRKMISVKDKYSIDIYKPEYEKLIVAIVITLQHMIIDKENARAAESGAAAGSFVIHTSR